MVLGLRSSKLLEGRIGIIEANVLYRNPSKISHHVPEADFWPASMTSSASVVVCRIATNNENPERAPLIALRHPQPGDRVNFPQICAAGCDAADRQRCALSGCPVLRALFGDRAGLPDFHPQF